MSVTNKIKWKIIKDYPDYKISENGDVIKIENNYSMTQSLHSAYYTVSLQNNLLKKQLLVHVLVAKAFIPNPDPKNLPIVDHIDNNQHNNHVSNLRWFTQSDNMLSYHNNFAPKRAILQYDMNKKFLKEWACLNDIIKENATYKSSTISNNLSKHNKNAYGFIWTYKIPLQKKAIKLPEKGEIFKSIPKFGSLKINFHEAFSYFIRKILGS